tara:strand:- start:298 stop:483 length:186 start_codon:yes stop_codon:yes gene_type:complete
MVHSPVTGASSKHATTNDCQLVVSHQILFGNGVHTVHSGGKGGKGGGGFGLGGGNGGGLGG